MKRFYRNLIIAIFVSSLVFVGVKIIYATSPAAIDLGAADNFAVLAGSGITDSNISTITGDVGLSPAGGSSYVALTAAEVTGTIYAIDNAGPAGSVNNVSLLTSAKNALTAAYLAAESSTPATALAPLDLGGLEFAPGVYNSGSSIAITGTTTLNAGGDPNAVFIFQAGSTLTTASNSHVNLINGAQACNVFWQVGSSATLGTYSDFKGNILALDSITDAGHSTINGRLLARNAAVTLDFTNLTKATCGLAAPQLTITKTVNNTHGGTKTTSSFSYFIDNVTTTLGVASTTSVGLHTVSETSDPGYTATYVCDGVSTNTITLALGDVKTCAITNNDIAPDDVAPTLTITKTVNNTHGGTKTTSSFSYFIDNVTTTLGVASTTSVGLHTVSETSDPGYISIIGGDCSSAGTTTLAFGETKTCTITNNDIAPRLVVIKTVVNDNIGTKVISDFPLFVDGVSVTSSVTSTVAIGLHTVSEISDPGYAATIGGDCAPDDGTITLALGDVKICTITNNDIAPVRGSGGSSWSPPVPPPVPPLIDVVKVPSPLALPAGPGVVVYNYTLHNVGTVPVANITMVDDTCSPVTLVSGDINTDSKLGINEIWKFTCSATLSKTHTNTVVATGWANGISTTDIANATVVVGAPVVPPLIHVTKVPSPLALFAKGGVVTYTEKVTNPGTVALSNVRLTDDKCSPVNYVSGDTNGDSKLDTNETWVYTCRANLSKTTTNTAAASGEANGLTAKDFAIATVVVAEAVPALPNTGFFPEGNMLWGTVVPVGIFIAFSALLAVFLRKHTM